MFGRACCAVDGGVGCRGDNRTAQHAAHTAPRACPPKQSWQPDNAVDRLHVFERLGGKERIRIPSPRPLVSPSTIFLHSTPIQQFPPLLSCTCACVFGVSPTTSTDKGNWYHPTPSPTSLDYPSLCHCESWAACCCIHVPSSPT